ncbi:fatty acyl-AMP ligase [Acinetobacter oleivorans]|uniref:fatty acyl-AMP ligase n=1 Tax=Acinetobacter oleivorans TaxID=1148157 RepID=UPI003F1A4438
MNIEMSLPQILADRALTMGDNDLYHYIPPRSNVPLKLTYRQLHEQSCQIASVLKDYGLNGKNALLMYPPGLDFIKAFFGCMRANVSSIPMYIPSGNIPDNRLLGIVETVEIKIVLTIKSKEQQIRNLLLNLLPDKEILIIATDEILLSSPAIREDLIIDLEQPALIQFTSGSTSKPKGVIVTHSNIVNNQYMIERGFNRHAKTSGGETIVSWLPFFHDMGLICSIMHPIFIGGCSVLMSPVDFLQNPYKWLKLISDYSAEIAGAPNFAYDYCVSRIDKSQIEDLDLSSWSVAYSGSEMIRPSTMKRFFENFSNYGFRKESIFYCYGMAETTLYVSGFTGGFEESETDQSVACVGIPDEKSEVLIVDENKLPLNDGQVGEIWIRGPHVAPCYLNNPEATEAVFEATLSNQSEEEYKQYLRTGDLGYMKNGFLYMVGRLKNVLVLNGKNYFGEEVEYYISKSNDYFVDSGSCLIQLNEGFENSEVIFMQEIHKKNIEQVKSDLVSLEESAIRLSRNVLNDFKLPIHRFIFLRSGRLPRTSSGKIDRGQARNFILSAEENCILDVEVN